MDDIPEQRPRAPLYDVRFEHDACGLGFVAELSGQQSHRILEFALQAINNLAHRSATDATCGTGDGAGVLTQIPYRLFNRAMGTLKECAVEPKALAIGVFFLPRHDAEAQRRCKTIVEETLLRTHLRLLGWRAVPIDCAALGVKAEHARPHIEHLMIARPDGMGDIEFERSLYIARREAEHRVQAEEIRGFYVPSLSNKTIVYKGLLLPHQLKEFYRDLQSAEFETAFAIFHERFSTNTFPNWFLAHPFRMLAHNGEINTLQGNQNSMRARECALRSEFWGEDIERLKPIIQPAGSDSANLDNVLEFLTRSGRSLLHSAMMLLPEAYEGHKELGQDLRGFYDYHACLMEPWDGPAAVAFSDGTFVGAALDRNGLRPARYQITDDNLLILASEVGVVDIDPSHIVENGRLGPGQMIAVDLAQGRLLRNEDIKDAVANQQPYRHWVRRQRVYGPGVDSNFLSDHVGPKSINLFLQQKAFGYTLEHLQRIIEPMGVQAKEPVGSMGDDSQISALAERPRLLYTYFKQRFAQVTNPPIDSLRERLVMSLTTFLGPREGLLDEAEHFARVIQFDSPILTNHQAQWLHEMSDGRFASAVLPCHFDVAQGEAGLVGALRSLCHVAAAAVEAGKSILILSDRGVSERRAPIPMLLAVGALHQHLTRNAHRTRVSLVVESGEPREDHHFACLLGFGASAINPYLAFETVADLATLGRLNGLMPTEAIRNYREALEEGLLKIMAKMGVSTLSSYHGAQMFEAIGLADEVIDFSFAGTPSRIGGLGMEEIAYDVIRQHRLAFAAGSNGDGNGAQQLEDIGYFRYRAGGEYHAFNPQVFKALHNAVRSGDFEGQYRLYSKIVDERPPVTLRDLLAVKAENSIPIAEVEPAETIVERFSTSAMSHGALGREAHELLAIATNRMGARSNSGEGGESPERYGRRPNGEWANSQIKQVASARFGVTTEYLVSATELQIKMAQGSKPGEGGQLPGHKVTEEIARIRHSVPGVTLISPPPHHDIYSIEDLAQLIYDLRAVNPKATISVKLVSEAGVGTVAAGVAKAHADLILISGHDGGTGASPLGSIKNAGIPWELGLAETQQVLVMNGLRRRVKVQVDGGLKTGRDVIVAALLGADEFGFGSAAVVAMGCVMARQCHLNTCPVGIATQRADLRERFAGKAEDIINFFMFVAHEVREILARLGYRSLEEIIGRADLLEYKTQVFNAKAKRIDLSAVLQNCHAAKPAGQIDEPEPSRSQNCLTKTLNDRILKDAMKAIRQKRSVRLDYRIRNTDRAIGARLAGEIASRYGDAGLPEGTIECTFEGSAGQSFGAFSVSGMRLVLVGEANDYVGKSMTGGEIIIRPSPAAKFAPHKNVVMGNTVLYGATGGTLLAAGRAGERFCVRNSGGKAVIEGLGDHGCEYMTGGSVVVLGSVGRNFGAGMTGGVAYVLDTDRTLSRRYNPAFLQMDVLEFHDVDVLHAMILLHLKSTGSFLAAQILTQWEEHLPLFWKLQPRLAVQKPSAAIELPKIHMAGALYQTVTTKGKE